ncbi:MULTISPECIES: DUF2497 domain-containing protein [unclassified Sphingomonas]|uniref:DUF2497 domain-containing protein n=1 Tax=unclassified Sphingomonas TaxID=196159 RepID=UPI0006F778D4|nr:MULTISPECIES: DUF2497 domain-containing protein [unclassified Sphingomonas]KQN03898.1 hypothetical protein ASE78_02220 [Sphingomonas sp. Leaf25]
MGDVGADTSMEDILSSIKRIIAEEGEGSAQAIRGRKSIRTAQPRELDDRDDILELNHSVAAPPPPRIEQAKVESIRVEPIRAEAPEPVAEAPRVVAEPEPPVQEPAPMPAAAAPSIDPAIVSDRAAEASRGSLDQLSRMLVKPETPGTDSLEGLVREMLRPMLREWLDAKLPGIVETMVAKEIARISGR